MPISKCFGDGLVDLDPVSPGNQVALRAAIRDINGGSTAGSIYVPRGIYGLTLNGAESASTNDLDITGDATFVGAGPGLTVIDASELTTGTSSRIFHVNCTSASLDLSRLTPTGASSNATGAALYVQTGAAVPDRVAVVGNTANGVAGGGIRSASGKTLTVRNSVFAGNSASNGGAIYADSGANLTIGSTIFAQNTATTTGTTKCKNVRANGAVFLNEGYRLLDDNESEFIDTDSGDYVDETIDPAELLVVTHMVDTIDASDGVAGLSLREPVIAANGSAGIVSYLASRSAIRLSRHSLRKRFQTACKVLGAARLESLTIHHGRHTFVRHALAGGRTMAEVRDAAGHANIAVTSGYLHAGVTNDEAVGRLFE